MRSPEKLNHAGEREGDILLHLQSCTSNALRHSLSAQGRPATSPHAQRAQVHPAHSCSFHKPHTQCPAPLTGHSSPGASRLDLDPLAQLSHLASRTAPTRRSRSHQAVMRAHEGVPAALLTNTVVQFLGMPVGLGRVPELNLATCRTPPAGRSGLPAVRAASNGVPGHTLRRGSVVLNLLLEPTLAIDTGVQLKRTACFCPSGPTC
jgi:hypothetical protein